MLKKFFSTFGLVFIGRLHFLNYYERITSLLKKKTQGEKLLRFMPQKPNGVRYLILQKTVK